MRNLRAVLSAAVSAVDAEKNAQDIGTLFDQRYMPLLRKSGFAPRLTGATHQATDPGSET
jgi:hypothetical protein